VTGVGPGPEYQRQRPPENRGFDLHVRDEGPANSGRTGGSALLVSMGIIAVALVAVVVLVFLR
jgi:hypothetical protein